MKLQVESICSKVIANEANLNQFKLHVSPEIEVAKDTLTELETELASIQDKIKTIPRNFTKQFEENILEIKREIEMKEVKQEQLESDIIQLGNMVAEGENQKISKINNFEEEFTNKFFQWSSDSIKSLKENQDRFKKQVLKQLKSCSLFSSLIETHPFHTLVYVWEIPEIKSKMKQHTWIYRSELFPLPGYSMSAFGVLENQCCQFRLDYYSDQASTDLRAPFKKVHPKITCVLKDLSGSETPRNVVRSIDCLRSKKMAHEPFDFGRFLSSSSSSPEIEDYVKNDAAIFEIHVETPSLATKSFSYNGVLFDVVKNYKLKKEMAEEEVELSHKSPYFYTSGDGYRVQVLLYLNAIGEYEGNGLTAAIRVLTGENDLSLPNSLAHTVTFTLFNQSQTTKHLSKCFEFDVKDETIYVDVESNDVIESEGFLENDALFYKVLIQKRAQQHPKKTKSAFKLFK